MAKILRIFREPLLHFLIIGAIIFAVYTATRPPEDPTTTRRIDISPAQVSAIVAQYTTVWKRPPSEQELQTLIDRVIVEEALVREARFLSLDSGDPVIRRRLAQKMQFLIESLAGAQEPDEPTLAAYYAENRARYAVPARYAFQQVFLGEAVTVESASEVVAALNEGADRAGLGVGSLLPEGLDNVTEQMIDRTFGNGFGAGVAAAEPGAWIGPVRSGYGIHAVRLDTVEPAREPDLADVRAQVAGDWQRDQAEALVDQQVARVLETYEVTRPTDAELQAVLQ